MNPKQKRSTLSVGNWLVYIPRFYPSIAISNIWNNEIIYTLLYTHRFMCVLREKEEVREGRM